jgi:hypothetical protein
VWAWAILKPYAPSSGDYDFGNAFDAMLRLGICALVTLFAWLVYFAARVWLGA